MNRTYFLRHRSPPPSPSLTKNQFKAALNLLSGSGSSSRQYIRKIDRTPSPSLRVSILEEGQYLVKLARSSAGGVMARIPDARRRKRPIDFIVVVKGECVNRPGWISFVEGDNVSVGGRASILKNSIY